MSDDKLRELERAWVDTIDPPGEVAVAYLAELVRTGRVTNLECVLAWRICRLESMFHEGRPMGGLERPFNPSSAHHARSALEVLFGRAPVLSVEHSVEQSLAPAPQPSHGAIRDVMRSILLQEGAISNPLEASLTLSASGQTTPPTPPSLFQPHCALGMHLGPLDYDYDPPRCERCGRSA